MEKHYNVIIIGSGPGGCTAGIYTTRSGLKTAIFTGQNIGGQLTITTDIENFPGFPEKIGGLELTNKFLKQAENIGTKIIYSSIDYVDLSRKPFICKSEDKEYTADNIVIATGADTKWLGLKSEKKFMGFGVSGCATCDGNFYKNQKVAVVGGGDTAGTEALHLSNIASKVYLIYRRSSLARMQDALSKHVLNNDKIEVIFNSEIDEIIGTENPLSVESIRIINNKTKSRSTIDVKGVFIAIGRKPESSLFKNTDLKINEAGYIITEPDSSRTNIKHVYAVGDVTNKKFKQAVVAAGFGSIAALEIEEDLHEF